MLGKNLIQAAAGAGAAGEATYVEDVFSTWLYTGNGSTQTITNGIDLAGEGGMVWIKCRTNATNNFIQDTVRGVTKYILTDSTSGEATDTNSITAFDSTGFTLGPDTTAGFVNFSNTRTYASWTFRKAQKFFDVVTWVGDGVNGRTVSHNLGSVPGCIIIKCTSTGTAWPVYHRGETRTAGTPARTYLLELNTTAAGAYPGSNDWIGSPTATTFEVGSGANVNSSGNTYVAYLFAHDAGGFGDDGTESVIKCGSFTTVGGTQIVDLGWEPQWLLVKRTNSTGNWFMFDAMRGMPVGINERVLYANVSSAEAIDGGDLVDPTATGFDVKGLSAAGNTFIYIAIRRGPMKTPTDATTVFSAIAATNASGTARTIGFPADMSITNDLTSGYGHWVNDRLRGYANTNATGAANAVLHTETTAAESVPFSPSLYEAWNTTIRDGAYFGTGIFPLVWYHFGRAPGFFDVVAYTGTGSVRTVSHNLGVAPELMIVKHRSTTGSWIVYSAALGPTKNLFLHNDFAQQTSSFVWNDTAPTSSVFTLGPGVANNNTTTYIAYLFATCPGVSKVGSYTGTGTTLDVDCGFTAGARFVLIKRTDSTGDWYVWDTARGIVSGNDPYLLLNSTAPEVTNTDYIDPLSSGFQISSIAPAAINASGGSFIFLAIA